MRPWLSVIAGGESLVLHAGGVLLVETARRSGVAGELSRLLGPWRLPLAIHDPGKIVTDLAIVVALGGNAAADAAGRVAVLVPTDAAGIDAIPRVTGFLTNRAADAHRRVAAPHSSRGRSPARSTNNNDQPVAHRAAPPQQRPQ